MDSQVTKTKGFDNDVIWEPFIKDGRAGYKVTRVADQDVQYIYFNPSSEGEGEADVFIYIGPYNDPGKDIPYEFYTVPKSLPRLEAL
jgi:hypothetical protein